MQRINLFDKSRYSRGYIDNQGSLIESDDWITTEFTQIYPEIAIQFSGLPNNSYVSFYNQFYGYIGKIDIVDRGSITPLDNSLFIRVTIQKDTFISILENYNFWKNPWADEDNMCVFNSGNDVNVELRGNNLVFTNMTGHEESDYPIEVPLFNYEYYQTQSLTSDTIKYYSDLSKAYLRYRSQEGLSIQDVPVTVSFTATSMRPIVLELSLRTGEENNYTYSDVRKVTLEGTDTFTFTTTCDTKMFTPIIKFPYVSTRFTVILSDIAVSFSSVNNKLTYTSPSESTTLHVEDNKIVDSGDFDCSYIIPVISGYNMYMYNYPLSHDVELAFTEDYPTVNSSILKFTTNPEEDTPFLYEVPTGANYLLVRITGDRPTDQRATKIALIAIMCQTDPLSNLDNVVMYQEVESFGTFRDDIYTWLKETLSPNLTRGDLDIIIRLMCYIFGDLTGLIDNLKDQIDADRSDEYYLKHLCSVIGYEWNEALTADQQRESIKLFIELRRRRGSIWSIENLIRAFGQDANSYYSTSDLRGVKVIEYNPDQGEPDNNGLYHGDLLLEVPQFSSILRFAIDNIRLIGTRIIFSYMIYIGIFKSLTTVDCGREIHQFFDPADWGYDPKIEDFGPKEFMYLPTDVKTQTNELFPYKNYLNGVPFYDPYRKQYIYPDKDGWYEFDTTGIEYKPSYQTYYIMLYFYTDLIPSLSLDKTYDVYATGYILDDLSDEFPTIRIGDVALELSDKLYQVVDSINVGIDEHSITTDFGVRPLLDNTSIRMESATKRGFGISLNMYDTSGEERNSRRIFRMKFFLTESSLESKQAFLNLHNSKQFPQENPVYEWTASSGEISYNGTIEPIKDWQISHVVRNAVSHFSTAIYIFKTEPYEKGPIWHEVGDNNYKGFLLDESTLQDDHTMYE